MNTFLISSESYHIINKEIKKIIKDNIFITFNMNKSSISELLEEASYVSLDSNKKYIIASNADFFGSLKITEEDSEKLDKYINDPNPDTIIIFTTLNGIDLRKKITKSIKTNNSLINIPKMDRKNISNLLNDYIKDNNYYADYNIINYIIDNSYNNVDIMINEIDKIMLYYNGPGKMKLDDIINIVGEQKDNNNFHFVSAVIDKKLDLALKLYENLKVYKVDATILIILLAREYRLMYYVKNMMNENKVNICSYLGLQDWQVNKLYSNSLKYTDNELLHNLVLLCKMDMNIKKGFWDKETILYSFLMEACS